MKITGLICLSFRNVIAQDWEPIKLDVYQMAYAFVSLLN